MRPLLYSLFFGLLCAPALAQPTGLPGHVPGFQGEYFADTTFTRKVHTRTDRQLMLDYFTGSPAPGITTDQYAIRWQGKLVPPKTGRYTLMAIVDDGIRLWIGGKLVMNEWRLQRATIFQRTVSLRAHQPYDIRVDYFNGKTASVLQLFWAYETDEAEALDAQFVYSPPVQSLAKVAPKQPQNAVADARQTTPQGRKPIKRTDSNDGAPPTAPHRVGRSELPPPAAASPSASTSSNTSTNIFAEVKKGEVIALNDVQFEQSSYLLLPVSHTLLDKLANALQSNPQWQIEIMGHTDNVGNAEKNLLLSKQRAEVVRNYLVKKGIAEARITATGFGGNRPLSVNTTEEGRRRNRRVEFKLK